MCRRSSPRPWECSGRAFFPESTPPGLNYAVLTGTLIGDQERAGDQAATPSPS